MLKYKLLKRGIKVKNWLYGKTVIISGASGGLGFNIAKILIEKYNCKIIGIARNKEKIETAISTLSEKKENFTYQLFDVSLKESWENFSNYLNENNIVPDILINNAGFMLPFKKFEKFTLEEAEEIVSTNLMSCVYSTHYLLPIIKKSSNPAIVNIASAAGVCPVVGESLYCMTKYGLRGFTETLQQDYRKKIYIGGVYPGFIKTNILGRMDESAQNNKFVQMMMMPVEKASKKIVKGIKRKRRNIVPGIEGKYMSVSGRLFPKMTPTFLAKIFKLTKLEIFNGVYDFSASNKTKENKDE